MKILLTALALSTTMLTAVAAQDTASMTCADFLAMNAEGQMTAMHDAMAGDMMAGDDAMAADGAMATDDAMAADGAMATEDGAMATDDAMAADGAMATDDAMAADGAMATDDAMAADTAMTALVATCTADPAMMMMDAMHAGN